MKLEIIFLCCFATQKNNLQISLKLHALARAMKNEIRVFFCSRWRGPRKTIHVSFFIAA
jgi:hypothetical protein